MRKTEMLKFINKGTGQSKNFINGDTEQSKVDTLLSYKVSVGAFVNKLLHNNWKKLFIISKSISVFLKHI